ncbi:hypothetical protein [Telmatospirillum sp.]|uniref:hypothetical protein n=1 Tax=Telmatospirillum sp. TaxID=2079197 RepID=UPI00284FCEC5|nr:hypothetical protein [Telmatospirillum sp.]MDR3439857.1 hypothetical protein [Telmatospirillum sp.]
MCVSFRRFFSLAATVVICGCASDSNVEAQKVVQDAEGRCAQIFSDPRTSSLNDKSPTNPALVTSPMLTIESFPTEQEKEILLIQMADQDECFKGLYPALLKSDAGSAEVLNRLQLQISSIRADLYKGTINYGTANQATLKVMVDAKSNQSKIDQARKGPSFMDLMILGAMANSNRPKTCYSYASGMTNCY